MTALYNDSEPFVADWLEALITHGLIAPGRVDRRSIADLIPADVAGPGQRHFFAGIGGWSYALRLAGVPDHAPVWTGSCPCQPLSDAGQGRGFRDPRHLWPAWFALILQCRPPVILGEQVASKLGLEWLDLVFSDLEGCGYTVGAADLCAAGVGAPHIRQRLYFVAHADGVTRRLLLRPWEPGDADPQAGRGGEDSALAHAKSRRRRQGDDGAQAGADGGARSADGSRTGRMANSRRSRGTPRSQRQSRGPLSRRRDQTSGDHQPSSPVDLVANASGPGLGSPQRATSTARTPGRSTKWPDWRHGPHRYGRTARTGSCTTSTARPIPRYSAVRWRPCRSHPRILGRRRLGPLPRSQRRIARLPAS